MNQSICEILRERMIAYIEPRDESVRWLSQRVGLPYSSVYRIISREAQNCTFRNAYQILRIVSTEDAKEILVKHFPTFAPLIANDSNLLENQSKATRAIGIAVQTEMLYVIHSMCSTALGSTRSEIKENYGKVGLDALDYLIDQEVVAEKRDGTIKDIYYEVNLTTQYDELKKAIKFNVDLINLSRQKSLLYNLVEGLSENGLAVSHQIVMRAIKELEEVKKNPEMIGSKKCFVNLLIGEFIPSLCDKE